MDADKTALHRLLQQANLLGYEGALLDQGADDLKQLRELEEDDFKQLCATISMATKPFHMMRFRKALRKYPPNSHARSSGTITANNTEPRQEVSRMSSASIFPLTSAQPLHALPRQPIRFAVSQPLTVPIFPTVAHSRSPTVHVASVNVVTPQASYIQPIHHPPALLQLQSPIATSQRQTPTSSKGGSTSQKGEPSQKDTPEKLKKLFLPPYLKPGSDCRSFDDLIDNLTPVQKELGPCPFSPNVWDPKRAELIRKYSSIYGQNVNKRKHGALTSHEENVNEAANQLCLRDPTLLVRREELLVLARRAVKEGGYVFIHGHSRTKDGENSLLQKRRRSSSEYFDDDLSQPLAKRSSQTPKLRERRLERIAELDLLITENKAEQSVKLAALEKAQQTDDFSAAYHIQFEMESLGNTLHQLQKEYSALKKKQRRSERYFESKHREKEGLGQSHPSDEEDDNHGCNKEDTAIKPDQNPGIVTLPAPSTPVMKNSTLQQHQPSQSQSSVGDDSTPRENVTICSSPPELVPEPHNSTASVGHSTPIATTRTGRSPLLRDSAISGHSKANVPKLSIGSPNVHITTANSPAIATSPNSTEVALEFERRHVPIYPTRHLQHVTAQVLRNRSRDSSLHNQLRGQRYATESRTTNEMTRLLSDFSQ